MLSWFHSILNETEFGGINVGMLFLPVALKYSIRLIKVSTFIAELVILSKS